MIRRAEMYLQEELYHSALNLFQKVQATEVKDSRVELGLAKVWFGWQNYHQARSHAWRAVQLQSDSATNWHLLGRISLRLGDPQQAHQFLEAALGLSPSQPQILADMGSTLLQLRRWEEAGRFLRQALALDADLKHAREDLALVLAGQRRGRMGLAHPSGSEPDGGLRQIGSP